MIRVVLIEDHSLVAEAIATMLGFEKDVEVVATTGRGAEAVDLVAEHEPDVVLMDVGLEGMNGLEATRRVRAAHPDIPVVILTMHIDADTVTEGIAAGASGFLPKDAERGELLAALRAVASGEAYLDTAATRRLLDRVGPYAQQALAGERLTDRELQVLELLTQGRSTKEIGEKLILGEETIKTYLSRIYQKLGVSDRVQAVATAIRRGLVP